MEERRKAQRRRQLVDRRTPEERRVGLERLLDPAGRSAEDIRRDAAEWSLLHSEFGLPTCCRERSDLAWC